MKSTTVKTTAYWITTAILALDFGVGGVFHVIRSPQVVTAFAHLGYPEYFVALLGIAKVLGAVALLAPRFPSTQRVGLCRDRFRHHRSRLFAGGNWRWFGRRRAPNRVRCLCYRVVGASTPEPSAGRSFARARGRHTYSGFSPRHSLRSRRLPLPDCIGEVRHPRGRL